MDITANGIVKTFGSGKQPKRALDDVSVRVGQGRFVAIVGESGSGKSTLARVVLGLLAADEGSVHYGETDISRTSSSEMRRLRRQVQCILQDPSGALNPRKTVGDILGEVIRLHKVEKESSLIRLKALQALELVDLQPAENYLRRYPHQLSGGQRQRVLIARAIVLDPQIIVADEAVSALDVSVKAGIINLLNDLGSRLDLGYLFITHDLPVVHKVADAVYVMKDGRVMEEGDTRAIFESPSTEYTRELIAAAPSPDPALAKQWIEEFRN